jgi:hypothetical protein
LFRRTGSHNAATTGTTFRPQINQPVSSFDYVQIVFNYDQCIAVIARTDE